MTPLLLIKIFLTTLCPCIFGLVVSISLRQGKTAFGTIFEKIVGGGIIVSLGGIGTGIIWLLWS